MTIITLDQLRRIAPTSPTKFADWVAPLNAATVEFSITSMQRTAMFITQIMHETGMLSRLVENLNYSAQGLANTWDRYSVTGKKGGAPNSLALRLDRKPEAIANNVYASRLGNGDEASGDGWRYRGRGAIQTTGKANYAAALMALRIDCIERPEVLELPENAARSAGLYWKTNGLNEIADGGVFDRTTKVVNGGDIGGKERAALYETVRKVIV